MKNVSSRSPRPEPEITIGALAKRAGVAVSAIRFYEEKGLINATRTAAGHRRYRREEIRKLSFVRIAQELGFPLTRIAEEMARLPTGKAPTRRDWERISKGFADEIDDRISRLSRLRDTLDGCIGCGCLSLKACALYNPGDRARARGPGARHIIDGKTDPSA